MSVQDRYRWARSKIKMGSRRPSRQYLILETGMLRLEAERSRMGWCMGTRARDLAVQKLQSGKRHWRKAFRSHRVNVLGELGDILASRVRSVN